MSYNYILLENIFPQKYNYAFFQNFWMDSLSVNFAISAPVQNPGGNNDACSNSA